jgi:hypothetical protein
LIVFSTYRILDIGIEFVFLDKETGSGAKVILPPEVVSSIHQQIQSGNRNEVDVTGGCGMTDWTPSKPDQ